jgi:thiamine-phosphate pyrophosphorylase
MKQKLILFNRSHLYPILDLDFCKKHQILMQNLIELWKEYSDCISFFQLRAKSISILEYEKLYSKILLEFPDCNIIVNDHWKFGIEAGAFGFHIGKEDYSLLSVEEKKEIQYNQNMIKGTSSHSIQDLKNLENSIWTYTGLGPIFRTNSKRTKDSELGVEIIGDAIHISKIPIVPIGGISSENFISLFRYGKILPASISMMANKKSLVKIVDFIRNHPQLVRESQLV